MHLRYNSPLSDERAQLLLGVLGEEPIVDVLDVGCGWGALLMDLLEQDHAARGLGIDLYEPDIVRAQREAEQRGLTDRAIFSVQDANDADTALEPADLVLNIGAFQAFGDVGHALDRLHALTASGGRLVLGAEYARHTPSHDELSRVWEGTTAADFVLLPDLVDRAISSGFRPLLTTTVTDQEWELYESGHMREREHWLARNPEHPDADRVRSALDDQRDIWLRGHRSFLGFAYLVLARVG